MYVKEALRIATQPTNKTAKLGDTVTFSVTASGGTAPYTYVWEYRAEYGSAWSTIGSNSRTLSVDVNSTMMVDYYYMYRCTVTDFNGNSVVSEIATLNR